MENNILIYLTKIFNLNAYIFDIHTKKKKIIYENFNFDFSEARNIARKAQKYRYSLINSTNFFTINILLNEDQLIMLVPNFTLANYLQNNINKLLMFSRSKMICQLIYEICTDKIAPSDELYINSLNSQSINLNDDYAVNDDILSFNNINIKISLNILRHDKQQFLFWKKKLLKNQFLISELNNKFAANMLIEYVALLSTLLINQVKIQNINIKLLDQILCIFFNLLLDERNNPDQPLAEKIKNYIDRNITHSLSLMDISLNLYTPLKQLNPAFKSKYNLTINQYIRHKKILIAKNLLFATQLTLQDIANLVGFNSQSYFVSTFKVIVGQTPSEYRNNCRK